MVPLTKVAWMTAHLPHLTADWNCHWTYHWACHWACRGRNSQLAGPVGGPLGGPSGVPIVNPALEHFPGLQDDNCNPIQGFHDNYNPIQGLQDDNCNPIQGLQDKNCNPIQGLQDYNCNPIQGLQDDSSNLIQGLQSIDSKNAGRAQLLRDIPLGGGYAKYRCVHSGVPVQPLRSEHFRPRSGTPTRSSSGRAQLDTTLINSGAVVVPRVVMDSVESGLYLDISHWKYDDERYIEQVGTYDSFPNDKNECLVGLNLERLKYWIGQGAQMDTVGCQGFFLSILKLISSRGGTVTPCEGKKRI
ncbi:unnamed protein product [Cyprideis torosa]|uniref:Small ribosomal subunit protein bS16m n=1 Tax=Cyprideis torosa TaxID=163714 RepID=A0A7R8ZHJ8_9CRUS|nr:unnamed protein product [Cyprideis torosa]CAG0882665.1 unnamed protein product [Cyprideis torosa]